MRLWISSLTDKAIREGLRKLEDGRPADLIAGLFGIAGIHGEHLAGLAHLLQALFGRNGESPSSVHIP